MCHKHPQKPPWSHYQACLYLFKLKYIYIYLFIYTYSIIYHILCFYEPSKTLLYKQPFIFCMVESKICRDLLYFLKSYFPLSQQCLRFTSAFQSWKKVVRHIFVFSRMNIPRLSLSELCVGQHVWKNKCSRRAQLQVSVLRINICITLPCTFMHRKTNDKRKTLKRSRGLNVW